MNDRLSAIADFSFACWQVHDRDALHIVGELSADAIKMFGIREECLEIYRGRLAALREREVAASEGECDANGPGGDEEA